ncbi:MAG: carboxypeptidase regulatory-like domain-containing protein [Janthinobacterium lividum]
MSSISGTVQDSSGAMVPRATVRLHRIENNVDRTLTTDTGGQYSLLNVEPGTYDVIVQSPGLASTTATGIVLQARQQLRYDVTLNVKDTQSVTVSASDAGVINLENAQISAVLTPQAVLDLPANYRGAGSTSPLSVVQALPGVQPDSGGYPPAPSTHPVPAVRYSIQGGLPSQTDTTVDGISAQNQTSNNVQADAFPSAESIAEIRVDGVNNNAEYGQPGEITTVTKSGTNHVHGSAYLYYQNNALDATPYGSDASTKPQKDAKDYGGSIGLPVRIPHVYDGRNRTFLFAAYEGLRFPQTVPIQRIVPTVLMKQGNFSQESSVPLQNPFTGANYANNIIPINPVSAKFLSFYPDPNIDANLSLAAAAADKGYNYLSSRRDDIDSNQFDIRGDHAFGSRASVSVRYSWKDNNQTQFVDLTLPNSNAFAKYRILASNFNYSITPRLVNEFKFGFTLEDDGSSNPFDGLGFTQSTGLNVLSTPAFFNGIPHLNFNGGAAPITSIGSRLGSDERSRVFQYIDNLTFQAGNHTLRFGTDLRHLVAHTQAGGDTPSINYGNFYFDAANTATGNQFADFLVGVPYQNQSNNIRQDNDATANSYAFYAQDAWKATSNLTLNFGLRYEFHPALASTNGLVGNFDSSIARTGRLIYPAGYASAIDVQELANVNACPTAGINNPYATGASMNGVGCTPVVSNTQAGLPAGLRKSPELRFMPRFGFAYRPFGNDKTAIRGGAGYYNITTTGALFYAIAQTLQQNYQTFTNNYSTGSNPANATTFVPPTFSFPGTTASGQFSPALGSVYFYSAIDPNWHDPYSLQTNLSIDHDFGHNVGGRVSYVGLHTWHLIWQPQSNQLARSKTRLSSQAPASDYPFPNFYQITNRSTGAEADYQSMQVEFTRRLTGGFSFNTAYTLAKNLADNQGSAGNFNSAGFVDEQGGYSATDSYDRHVDYGNVAATRRNRSLTTAIYQLPFGSGHRIGGNFHGVANSLASGWQLSSIFLWQSGPFLTAYFPAGFIDPSGTGSGTYVGGANQRPDRIANANSGPRTRDNYFNRNAFACPGSNDPGSVATCDVGVGSLPIGRYGTESTGDLHGPGTVNLSTGASKSFQLKEGMRLRTEGTFTNVLNHTNLADPGLDLTSANFGKITQSRGSDFGGNRTGQVSVRFEF